MANPENKQIPYESTQKDIRDAIESVATAIGGISAPSAEDVSYDNSGSGLSATDVQNALDEIVSDIPTVNDGVLTIQQNGTSIGSFSANTASNVTANIKTPTADKKTATDEFTTADGGLLSKCMIDLVPVQSGSGDPSPDNVRPISGHTEVDLLRCGKNKLPHPTNGTYGNVVVTTNNDGSVSFVGNCNSNASVDFYRNPARLPDLIEPSKTYAVSLTNAIDAFEIYYSTDGSTYDGTPLVKLTTTTTATFTVPSNATGLLIRALVKSGTNYNVTIYPQIEKGSTATSYEPYLGHLYQVQIGSTVYGGYVDLVSGVMIAEYAILSIADLSGWFKVTDDPTYPWFATLNGLSGIDVSKRDSIICNKYKNKTPSTSNHDDSCFGLISNGSQFRVRDMRYNTATDFANSLSDCEFIVPLATPQTIQLTPQQIETLAGQNNLSTPLSGQSIETNGVEYKELFTFADVKEYVDKKIPDAPTTDGTYTLQAVVSGGVPTYSWV